MAECPNCGRRLIHTPRRRLQRLFYTATLRCPNCGVRVRRTRPLVRGVMANGRFVFSRHTTCIRCGTHNVERAKPDRIDSTSKNIFSWMQRFLGAPLIKCHRCRLIFYDWRPVRRHGRPD